MSYNNTLEEQDMSLVNSNKSRLQIEYVVSYNIQ